MLDEHPRQKSEVFTKAFSGELLERRAGDGLHHPQGFFDWFALKHWDLAERYMAGYSDIRFIFVSEKLDCALGAKDGKYQAVIQPVDATHINSDFGSRDFHSSEKYGPDDTTYRDDLRVLVKIAQLADRPEFIVPSRVRLKAFVDVPYVLGQPCHLSLCSGARKICSIPCEREVDVVRFQESRLARNGYSHLIQGGSEMIGNLRNEDVQIFRELAGKLDLCAALVECGVVLYHDAIGIAVENVCGQFDDLIDVLIGPFEF